MGLAVYAVSVVGLACIALSMARHARDVFARELTWPERSLLRGAGAALQAAAFALCVVQWDAAIGLIAWVGTMTVAALSVTALLTLRNMARSHIPR